ncbi:MAG: hypothetical protein Tsb009_18890 [Planctomycetaceae bacterium]
MNLVKWTVCLTVFCCLQPGSPVAAEDSLTRYFEGLRQRQLFRLAETTCLRRLANPRLTAEMRGQLTLELSRIYAAHAKFTTGSEQQRLWSSATKVIEEHLKSNDRVPISTQYRLKVQQGIVAGLQAEFERWNVECSPGNSAVLTNANRVLQNAARRLHKLESELETALRKERQRLKPQSGTISPIEIKSLLKMVRYQRALVDVQTAIINSAKTGPAVRNLNETNRILIDLANGPVDSPITWNSRVLLATTARLSGRLQRATDRLKTIEKKRPPVNVIDRTVAERIRILLALNGPLEAEKMLDAYHRQRGGLTGELSFLRLQVDLRLAKLARASQKSAAERMYLKQAERHVTETEKTLGGYWSWRCRLLWRNAQENQKFGPELAAAIRKAESLQETGQTLESAKEFGRAAKLAEEIGKTNIAADLWLTQAAIYMSKNDYRNAATAYRMIVDLRPQHSRSAQAHILWAYCLGRIYATSRTKDDRLAYMTALENHRKQFPKSPTAAEATWMLATLQEHRLQLTAALKLYQTIPLAHARGKSAQVAIARCYEGILERLRTLNRTDDLKIWETYATDQLESIVERFPTDSRPLDIGEAEIAMRLARIQLNRNQPQYAKADRLLERILSASSHSSTQASDHQKKKATQAEEWRQLIRMVRQLRIVSLAGSGKTRKAQAELRQLSQSGTADVLAVLDGLMQLTSGTDEKVRQELGNLQLQVALELNRKRAALKVSEQAWLDRCLAQAYVSSGQPERAIVYYEQLLKKSPQNMQLLKTTAELLLKSQQPEKLNKAGEYWRKIESTHKRGSEGWLNARYHVAYSLYRLKKFAECRKLITVTELLYPRLGGGELARKYGQLQVQLKRHSP